MLTNKLVNGSLKFLKIAGMDPSDNDIITKIKRFVCFLVNVLLYADFVLIILFDWKGFDSIDDVTIYVSFMHVGFKLTSLILKQQQFISIFQTMSNFTNWESLQGEIKDDVEETAEAFLKMMKMFKSLCTTAGIGYCFAPLLFAANRQTPIETHFSRYFDNTAVYIAVYILHAFDLYVTILTVLGYDCLYVSLITTINIEIQIIKHRIQNIMIGDAEEDKIDEISQIVAQHNLVLKAIRQCNKVFSDVLLVVFLTSIVFLATALVSIMETGFPPPLGTVLTYGLHLSSTMFQLFIYSTLGQILINQSSSISDEIYNIKWWTKPRPKLRQACILMIQRSNKLDCLTAAGMFIVNYESYSKVLKFGLSVFSLAQAMKTRNAQI